MIADSHHARGLAAEERAAEHFQSLGFHCLARRWRCSFGEIDLITERDGLVVFAEVKRRRSLDDAAFSVQRVQQKRIAAAAQMWIAQHPAYDRHDFRFDAVFIYDAGGFTHLEDAFHMEEAW